jgi:hypothetical protein
MKILICFEELTSIDWHLKLMANENFDCFEELTSIDWYLNLMAN